MTVSEDFGSANLRADGGETAESSVDGTDRCERRGCERDPTHELVTESSTLHKKPIRWPLCDEHARVAAEEFQGTTNILAARKLATSGQAKPHLVADGGTVEDSEKAFYRIKKHRRVRRDIRQMKDNLDQLEKEVETAEWCALGGRGAVRLEQVDRLCEAVEESMEYIREDIHDLPRSVDPDDETPERQGTEVDR